MALGGEPPATSAAAAAPPAGPPGAALAAAASLDLGPRLPVFLSDCFGENRLLLLFCLLSAGLALVATLGLTLRQRRDVAAAPLSLQRLYYLRALWFAPAFGLTSFLSLLCPRAYHLCKMVQLQFEGINILVFGTILFLLMAEESHRLYHGSDSQADSIGRKIVGALAAQGPKRHFGVPPFGCCVRPLLAPHHLAPRHLILARNFFRQYAFVIVIFSMLSAYAAISLPGKSFSVVFKVLGLVEMFSGFLAIYGLMVLYVATHDLLHEWRTTSKFVAIKLVVMLCTFQDLLVGQIVKHVEVPGFHCLGAESHREHFWNMYLTCLESVLVAFLVGRAFPASEIQTFEGEFHLELVEMELEALQRCKSAAAVDETVEHGEDAQTCDDSSEDTGNIELADMQAQRAG